MSGTLTSFTPGDLVISVYGAANGTGTYTLDQASAITLEELTPAKARWSPVTSSCRRPRRW